MLGEVDLVLEELLESLGQAFWWTALDDLQVWLAVAEQARQASWTREAHVVRQPDGLLRQSRGKLPVSYKARVCGLALHAVECALLLREQRALCPGYRHRVLRALHLELPVAREGLHSKYARQVRDAGLRSIGGGHQEDVFALAYAYVDASGSQVEDDAAVYSNGGPAKDADVLEKDSGL